MRSTYWRAIALAGAASFGSHGSAQETSMMPGEIAAMFCAARVAGDMEPVAGVLTEDLWTTIIAAYDQNEAWAAANPGEKPPLGDGIPWAAFPDRPDECTTGDPQWQMDEARLKVSYGFSAAQAAACDDSLLLRQVSDATGTRVWRIDNVVYATGGDLRTVLVSAFTP